MKPGKGNALYKCKLRNLIRNTTLDRTYKGGDSLESADINEIAAQYLYRQGDTFVFMDNETYEQYELTSEQIDDGWKYLIEGMKCSMMLYNNAPIAFEPPNHVTLKVEYCEPGAKGNTATNVTKPVKVETGGEFQCPAFINMGDTIKIDTRDRRVCRAGEGLANNGQLESTRRFRDCLEAQQDLLQRFSTEDETWVQ